MMKKMWKRMLAILLTVLMLGGAAPLQGFKILANAVLPSYVDAYKQFILSNQVQFDQFYPDYDEITYSMHDMNGDDIPELIAEYGNRSFEYLIYSYIDQRVEKICSKTQVRREILYKFRNNQYSGIVVHSFDYNTYGYQCEYWTISLEPSLEIVVEQVYSSYYDNENYINVFEKLTTDENLYNTCQGGLHSGYLKEITKLTLSQIKEIGWNAFFYLGGTHTGFNGYACWEDAYYDYIVNKAFFVQFDDYEYNEKQYAYLDILSNREISGYKMSSDWFESRFGLYDMNNDHVPELLVWSLECYSYLVYTFSDNQIVFCGTTGYRSCPVDISQNKVYSGIFVYYGSNPEYHDSYYYLEDNILKEEIIELTDSNSGEFVITRETQDDALYSAYLNRIGGYAFMDYHQIETAGWGLFLMNALDPTIYCKALALYATDLCEAANATYSDNITAKFREFGFSIYETGHYGGIPIGYVIGTTTLAFDYAYAIAYKKVDNTAFLNIVARGTTSINEAIHDQFKGGTADFLNNQKVFKNVTTFEDEVWTGLNNFVGKHPDIKKCDKITIFVTGHSLGGACASALAAHIDYDIDNKTGWLANVSKNAVHAYTLGAIKAVDSDTNVEDGYENIHNIYNLYDSWGPYGKNSISGISSVYAKFGHTDLFSYYVTEGANVWDMQNHDVGTYRTAIQQNFVNCKNDFYSEDAHTQAFWDKGVKGVVQLNFEEEWFRHNSLTYSPDLCRLCADFSMLGYSQDDGEGNYNELIAGLKKCGFGHEKWAYKDILVVKDPDRDRVDFFIAYRTINVDDTDYTLIFMGLIGTNGPQWYTDFEPGTGETHEGFQTAMEYAYRSLAGYMHIFQLDRKENVKILLTGHSRGAATANLMAAKIINEKKIMESNNYQVSLDIQPKDIFTYTFATPNNTRDSKRGDSKYRRIFNIVNPEDFVTKCMPADWGYGRYGRTYSLPSKTSTVYYYTYLNEMQNYYQQFCENKEYHPYMASNQITVGELPVYAVVKTLTSRVHSVDEFYNSKFVCGLSLFNSPMISVHNFFQNSICSCLASSEWSGGWIYGGINTFSPILEGINGRADPLYLELATFFVTYGAIKDSFEHSHMMQTYCAYVHALAGIMDYFEGLKGFAGSVNCPVDVEVRDKATGEVVGRIVNNMVDETVAAKDNAIVMTVNGDSKSFWLPGDGSYTVKLTGNDNGTMDYTLAEIDPDTGEVARVNFFDTKITKGKSWTGEAGGEDYDVETHTLKSESGETKTPTETVDDTETRYTVTLNAEGDGFVTGGCTAVSGDCVTITAEPDEGRGFVGWYENGKLLSTDKEYAFVLKADRNITGRFAPKPTCSITSTHDVTASQTVTLSMTCDNGVAGYYWSTSPDCSDAVFNAVSGAPTTASVQKIVSRKGTYYLTAKDTKGAVSETVSITFCETVFENPIISEPDRIVLSERGSTFTVPECKTEDYRALSWGEDASIKPGDLYTVTENRTLFVYYAWHNSDTVYLVAYEPNGGSDEWYGELEYIGNPLRIIETIPNHKTLAFKEWNTQADGSGDGYRPGDLYSGSEDLTLYAVWKEKTPPVSLKINAPEKAYYKKPFVVSITTSQLPEGAQIKWTTNSNNAYASQGLDNRSFTLTPKDTGTFDLTVTIYSEDGEKLAEDSVNIVFTYAWWQWLIRIFLLGFIWY